MPKHYLLLLGFGLGSSEQDLLVGCVVRQQRFLLLAIFIVGILLKKKEGKEEGKGMQTVRK